MTGADRSRSPRGRQSGNKVSTPEQQQKDRILVVDFGSQVSHLICRRVREANVYCELRSCLVKAEEVVEFKPTGIILSGGPHSVYDADGPHLKEEVWKLIQEKQLPVLGICYGLQEMCFHLGGAVEPGKKREFGHAEVQVSNSELFKNIQLSANGLVKVWMSHGDKVTKLPAGFQRVAHTPSCEFAAVENVESKMWGVQFHPEVTHTPCGAQLIKNFVQNICGCKGEWTMQDFARSQADTIVARLGDRYCIGAVSGGVDSSVAAALLHRAVGTRFRPFHVDTGLLRKDEAKEVKERLAKHFEGPQLKVIDAREKFYDELAGVTEPEQKRKIIERFGLFVVSGMMELRLMDQGSEAGNLGDPIGFDMYLEELQNEEINNGCMAMISALGIFAVEYAIEQLTLFAFAFDPAAQIGAVEPMGYFDLLGFTKVDDKGGFNKLRAADIKHDRVPMLASIGAVAQPLLLKLPGLDSPDATATFGALAVTLGLLSLSIGSCMMELRLMDQGREPDNIVDPVDFDMYQGDMRNEVINTGRTLAAGGTLPRCR